MRNLATIQRVKNISPIPNADAIEMAEVLGWQLVVKKGEFNEGSFGVYCEIDSLMPNRSEFEFLRPLNMLIRTVRMRGQISQGICFPLSILPEGVEVVEGKDVTDILGIIKYEDKLPDNLIGEAKGYMPSRIPKTDILRVQTCQEVLDKYCGVECYGTEKLDGESITFYLIDNIFGVCSKEVDFIETEKSVHWQVARQLDIENKMHLLNGNFALQGELIGEGIKGNKYKLKGRSVRFFNIFDIDKYKFLDFSVFCKTINTLSLETVPVVFDSLSLSKNIHELVQLSIGKSKMTDGHREGIIIGPMEERNDMIGRVQVKVINPEFLLKHKE